MLVDRKYIKYAPRVKDINRQYEMNNNGEVDNGVYNKFVRQSTENANLMDDIMMNDEQQKDKNNNKDELDGGLLGKNLLS